MPKLSITVPDHPMPHFGLSTDEGFFVRIGRSDSADICIPIPSVSSLHCELVRVPGGYELRDKDSTNGLRVGDSLVKVAKLKPDQQVYLGEACVEIILTEEDKALFAKELEQSSSEGNNGDDHANKVAPCDDSEDAPLPVGKETPEQKQGGHESGNVMRPVDFPLPVPGHIEYGQLHYEEKAEEQKSQFQRPTLMSSKKASEESQVVPMVLYGVLMFLLAIGAGLTYQHYKTTGELLPLELGGIDSPKKNLEEKLQEKQEQLGESDPAKATASGDTQETTSEEEVTETDDVEDF